MVTLSAAVVYNVPSFRGSRTFVLFCLRETRRVVIECCVVRYPKLSCRFW